MLVPIPCSQLGDPCVGVSMSRAGKAGLLLLCSYLKPASEDSRDTWMLFMSRVQFPSCITRHQVSNN